MLLPFGRRKYIVRPGARSFRAGECIRGCSLGQAIVRCTLALQSVSLFSFWRHTMNLKKNDEHGHWFGLGLSVLVFASG